MVSESEKDAKVEDDIGGESQQTTAETTTIANGKSKKKSYTDKNTGIKITFNNADEDVAASETESKEPTEAVATEDEPTETQTKQDEENTQEAETEESQTSNKRKSTTKEETPKPKKSRKLQGAGVKKPLYSRYESLYIVKAYKTISDKYPNLVLIDLFKIVANLFNNEAKRQGFKERTPDQLYQKYKRIQHGLNHGETEFVKIFKKNKYNEKEWIPDFTDAGKDEVLQSIRFPNVEGAIREVIGSNFSSKGPQPDLYDDDDDDENSHLKAEEGPDAEEELLQLAGYSDKPTNGAVKSYGKELAAKIRELHANLAAKDEQINQLKATLAEKDKEIQFLRDVVSKDLGFIKEKITEES